jgi:hypothetical protein
MSLDVFCLDTPSLIAASRDLCLTYGIVGRILLNTFNNEVTLMTLYTLPHKFTVHPDSEMDGCFILMCNGNFVHWAETLDDIFIAYGNHLKHAKG